MANKKKKTDVSGWIIFLIITFACFSPMFCRVCKKVVKKKTMKPYVESTNFEDKKIDRRYHLQFNNDFKKGLSIQDDLGISIVIAIDCSGSMDDIPLNSRRGKKYILASQALTEIMVFLERFYNQKLVNDNIILKLGLIKFSSNVTTLYKLTEMNNNNFKTIKSITSNINNFIPTYKTAIGEALEVGAEMLVQSGTIFNSLIIITDGENTIGTTPEEVLAAIVNNLNNQSTEDFPIYTDNILVSFIGFDIDSGVFSNLGDIGSRVTSADSKEELRDALKNIFIADITKLESE